MVKSEDSSCTNMTADADPTSAHDTPGPSRSLCLIATAQEIGHHGISGSTQPFTIPKSLGLDSIFFRNSYYQCNLKSKESASRVVCHENILRSAPEIRNSVSARHLHQSQYTPQQKQLPTSNNSLPKATQLVQKPFSQSRRDMRSSRSGTPLCT